MFIINLELFISCIISPHRTTRSCIKNIQQIENLIKTTDCTLKKSTTTFAKRHVLLLQLDIKTITLKTVNMLN